MDAVYPPPIHATSVASSAAPIVVPKLLDLTESATCSPAITTTGAGSMPPSVSPMAPTYHMNSVLGDSIAKAKVTTKSQAGMNGGRWTEQEHQSFLAGLRLYGREWKKVASKIKTRTSAQIRSHAQKYFAKLARDDETRKLGHGLSSPGLGVDGAGGSGGPQASSLYGYMSDDGSSTTAGNLSGDEGGDTDSSTSLQQRPSQQPSNAQQPRSFMPVHPFPSNAMVSPTPPGGHPTGVSMTSASSLFASLLPSHKKRARPLGSASELLSPLASSSSSSLNHPFKHRKTEAPLSRLPSPEELVEEVSPRVRQRLSSLIESEICALQVLSCYTWLQQQQQQNDLKVQLQAPPSVRTPHRLVGGGPGSSSTAPSAVFPSPAGGSMSLAMITAERSPSIF